MNPNEDLIISISNGAYDQTYDRTYLAELCLPPGCDIRRKCNECPTDHYCQYYRYNYNSSQCSCICVGTCEDCRDCSVCNTPHNRMYAGYYRFRWRWRQSRALLHEIHEVNLNKQCIESGFKDIWPADGLIYQKIRSYLTIC